MSFSIRFICSSPFLLHTFHVQRFVSCIIQDNGCQYEHIFPDKIHNFFTTLHQKKKHCISVQLSFLFVRNKLYFSFPLTIFPIAMIKKSNKNHYERVMMVSDHQCSSCKTQDFFSFQFSSDPFLPFGKIFNILLSYYFFVPFHVLSNNLERFVIFYFSTFFGPKEMVLILYSQQW